MELEAGSPEELSVSEEHIIERARKGDREAWDELYRLHVDRVYRYIASKVGDAMMVEDLTQEVFLKAFQSLSSFRWRGKPFAAWLFTIARNLIIDMQRKQQSHKEVFSSPTFISEAAPPEAEVEQRMKLEAIMKAMSRLTPLQQEVIGLRFAAGLTLEETARVMGKKVGAIKALQHSAIAALRRALQEYG